jgi:hypothetical protein
MITVIPGVDEALAYLMHVDNRGPQTVAQVWSSPESHPIEFYRVALCADFLAPKQMLLLMSPVATCCRSLKGSPRSTETSRTRR